MTAYHQVVLFLLPAKVCASERFLLLGRKKNLDTVARPAMSVGEARERVLSLKPEDYVAGPERSLSQPGEEVWVFGLREARAELYVKFPLTYPLKEGEDRTR